MLHALGSWRGGARLEGIQQVQSIPQRQLCDAQRAEPGALARSKVHRLPGTRDSHQQLRLKRCVQGRPSLHEPARRSATAGIRVASAFATPQEQKPADGRGRQHLATEFRQRRGMGAKGAGTAVDDESVDEHHDHRPLALTRTPCGIVSTSAT